jgi:cell division protein FtsB
MESGSKNIFIYFILLLTLFVLLFFTKDYFSDYQIKQTEVVELEKENIKLDKEIDNLENNKKNLLKNSKD